MSNNQVGGTQSPPLQGKENDPVGQSAPGKDSSAIPDQEQRAGVFGGGESKSSESGDAGQGDQDSLKEAVGNAKHAGKSHAQER